MRGRAPLGRLQVRDAGLGGILMPHAFARRALLFAADRVGRRAYRGLSVQELRATRTSDTAFVFGSGRSLLQISEDEWRRIAGCNTISLREFPRQRWVRADYHVTAEVDDVDAYAARIRDNPLYAETAFVVQEGFRAVRANELIARRLLPRNARVFRFRRAARGRAERPSRTPRRLAHGYNSIFDATNLAFALGFRRIVLAGADYYDKGYFWLAEGETRAYEKPGVEATSLFTGARLIVSMMGDWCDLLRDEGVELAVYNPRSLLAERLPVFSFAL